MEQIAQSRGRCPIPGKFHDYFGQGSEQPGLVENVHAHCRCVWTR